MTTVAAKNGEMVADTQCTGDYTLRVQKIFRLQDGGVVGMAGNPARGYAAAQWMAAGEQGDPPKMKGASLLILRPDGSLWVADDELPAFPLLDKEAAIGSGAAMAMTAMRAGASAGEAVRQVAKLDPYTSDPIQILKIEPVPKRVERDRKAKKRRLSGCIAY